MEMSYDSSNKGANERSLGFSQEFFNNLKKASKTYFIDTNWLISNPYIISILSGDKKSVEKELGYFSPSKKDFDNKPNNIVLSEVVLKELDYIKDGRKRKKTDMDTEMYTKIAARKAIRQVLELYNKAEQLGTTVFDGVPLGNGGFFFVKKHSPKRYSQFSSEQDIYLPDDNDLRIIFDVYELSEAQRNQGIKQAPILISQDTTMKIKAKNLNDMLRVEKYRAEEVKEERIYPGIFKGEVKKGSLDKLIEVAKGERIAKVSELIKKSSLHKGVFPNMVISLEEEAVPGLDYSKYLMVMPDGEHIKGMKKYVEYLNDIESISKKTDKPAYNRNLKSFEEVIHLYNKISDTKRKYTKHQARYTPEELFSAIYNLVMNFADESGFGFDKTESFSDANELFSSHPFYENISPKDSQIPYFEMLLDEKIPAVSVIGEQGSGKSILALLAGTYKLYKGDVNRITVIRSAKEIGNESMGYLPGTQDEKMSPWMSSVNHSLEEIFSSDSERANFRIDNRIKDFVEQLNKRYRIIELVPVQFLQGATITKSAIIADEFQNFPYFIGSIILGRVGKGSDIACLGDPKQLDAVAYSDRYVNLSNSSIIRMANKMKELDISAHITLPEYFTMRSEVAKLGILLSDPKRD